MKTTSIIPGQLPQGLLKTLLFRFIGVLIVMSAIILLPAGTFYFWQYYLYVAILLVCISFVLFYFMRHDVRFLERRMKIKERERSQQTIVLVTLALFLMGYALCGFDHRFQWSDIPNTTVIFADLFVVLGYLFVFFVFKENSFASRVVEVDREQTVISTGPYSVIRHPMYLGMIVMYLATPIALGSYWALIPFGILPIALIFRILNEEKILREKLSGYTDYCRKVRCRLIPFVW